MECNVDAAVTTSECKTSTFISLISFDINYFFLLHSPTTEFAGTFFWCHRVSATEIQGKPIYRNEKEKEWRDARMLICIFAQIVKMLLAPWHHAI